MFLNHSALSHCLLDHMIFNPDSALQILNSHTFASTNCNLIYFGVPSEAFPFLSVHFKVFHPLPMQVFFAFVALS
jgi:hypothetical protein